MNSGTLTAAALSLSAAAIWGGGDFAGGIAVRRANVFRVVAGAHACGLVLMLALAWITGEPMPPYSSLGWGVVAGITGGFGIAALYEGLSVGRMGVVAPVASVITAVLPVLFGFRTEGLPDRLQLAGFALALVSIWFVARPDGKIDSHRGVGLAILAGVMFGLFLISGKQAGHGGVFWPLVAARAASTLLMLLIVAFSAARSALVASRAASHSLVGLVRFRRQRNVHRRYALWTAGCRSCPVVALSREHRDPGASVVEGAHLADARGGHCGSAGCGGADFHALGFSRLRSQG